MPYCHRKDMILIWSLLLSAGYQVNGQISCAELKQQGDLTNGLKTIDPEEAGAGGIQVECDMTSDPNDGITIIKNGEVRRLVNGYESTGQYSRTISYSGFTMEQIAQLITKSASCEQYVEFESHHSWMYFYANNPFAWWVSRDGEHMYTWGGGKTYKRTCACGLTGSCSTSSKPCNADTNDYRTRFDSGILTDRARLPVTKFQVGDTGTSYEYAFFIIGPLKCRGVAPPALHSCAEVKAAGFTKTDSYLIDPDGDGGDDAYWAYCDLELSEDEVTTVVFHDVPYRTFVEGPTTHLQVFTYWASDAQMMALTAESNACQQYFNIDVKEAHFGGSYWLSITGVQMKNWGLAPGTVEGCPCSLTDSCYNGELCNGYANDGSWREDRGDIIDKEEMPIKELKIADVDSSSESAYFRIGPLICQGSIHAHRTVRRATACYKVITAETTWQEAANACKRINAYLATIDDDDERVYLTKLTHALVGPLSTLWSAAECTPIDSADSDSCDAQYGYICESKLSEIKSYKNAGMNKSPLGSSLLSSRKAVSSGVCSLYCEDTANCNSFSYNADTHDCKMSSETTDSSAVSEDGYELFTLKSTYQSCAML
ncbi:contactin-associated protein like 5-1-like [Antedon mediterranea]|uniref:contactin-associated protein like 5-1-like n=1 Tax=Antedon mediterranea TaxID=105859 RepID=UPI003AF7F75A